MDNKYNVLGIPWRGKIGIGVKDCKTSQEVIETVGLNWQVKKWKLVPKSQLS